MPIDLSNVVKRCLDAYYVSLLFYLYCSLTFLNSDAINKKYKRTNFSFSNSINWICQKCLFFWVYIITSFGYSPFGSVYFLKLWGMFVSSVLLTDNSIWKQVIVNLWSVQWFECASFKSWDTRRDHWVRPSMYYRLKISL